MNNLSIIYPFDPLGTNVQNKVVEFHSLSTPNDKDYHFFIPRSAPFFGDSTRLKITHVSSGKILTDGIDFVKTHYFFAASRSIGLGIYGGIAIRDRALTGNFKVESHTIGGTWNLSETAIVEHIANLMNNPRITYWDNIVGVPDKFPAIDHFHDINADLTGVGALEEQLIIMNETLRDSLRSNSRSGRNELPPIRSVYNSNNQLITLQETWTNFGRIALEIPANKWVTNVSFNMIGGRPSGMGTNAPSITCQINFKPVLTNGVMVVDSMTKRNNNVEGANLRIYAVVVDLVNEAGNTQKFLQLYLRDKQLRASVQILDLSEFKLLHLSVPYHDKLESVTVVQPVGTTEFTTVS